MAVVEGQGRQPNEPTSMYVPSNYVTLFAKSCPKYLFSSPSPPLGLNLIKIIDTWCV